MVVTYLQADDQRFIACFQSPPLPMLIDVFRKDSCPFTDVFVERGFHVFICQNRWAIYRSIRLFCLGCVFKEIHNFLEGIFRALSRRVSFFIKRLQENVILIVHVIRTSTTVLYGGRKANVRRWLSEDTGIQAVILDGALDCLRGRYIDLIDLTAYGSSLRCW